VTVDNDMVLLKNQFDMGPRKEREVTISSTVGGSCKRLSSLVAAVDRAVWLYKKRNKAKASFEDLKRHFIKSKHKKSMH
jgi:hypothetical protein